MGERNTTTRRFGLPELPLKRVHVELTNACNFCCEFCPNQVMARPKGVMSRKLWETILEEIAQVRLSSHVLFHQQGEPTLHRELDQAVRRASELGLRACLVTNGSMLTDRMLDSLLEAGLSELVISLHTPDEASYRVRGAHTISYALFEQRVITAARRMLAAPAKASVTLALLTRAFLGLTAPTRGRDWPLVGSNAELRDVVGRWIDRLGVSTPSARDALRGLGVNRRIELEVAPRLRIEVRPVAEWPLPMRAGRWYPARIGRCPVQGLTDHFAILWDGRYSYCCDDHDGRTCESQFQATSLLDFLDSEPVQAAIDGFARRRPANPYCRLCLGASSRSLALLRGLGTAAYYPLTTGHCCAGDAAESTDET